MQNNCVSEWDKNIEGETRMMSAFIILTSSIILLTKRAKMRSVALVSNREQMVLLINELVPDTAVYVDVSPTLLWQNTTLAGC